MGDQNSFDQFMVLAMIAIFSGAVVNGLYILMLGRFYRELEQKDPEAWLRVGSPRLGEQAGGRGGFRSFYAFLGVLRAKTNRHDYPDARWAWLAFRIAGVTTVLIFIVVGGGMIYLSSQGES
jgi:hypothetical protein